MDIINLAFVTDFPTAIGGTPGTNFGNQCSGATFQVTVPLDGGGFELVNTTLLEGCYQIYEDIPICQAMGKKILLSLGGESVHPIGLTDLVAESFADYLWYSFGPQNNEEGLLYPRPFMDVSVDGFDFDIENGGSSGRS